MQKAVRRWEISSNSDHSQEQTGLCRPAGPLALKKNPRTGWAIMNDE